MSRTVRKAFYCGYCGHIRRAFESRRRCWHCGASPVNWLSEPVLAGPVDADVPHVAEPAPELLATEQTNDPAGLFATSPPGTEGYDVNPELRVRY